VPRAPLCSVSYRQRKGVKFVDKIPGALGIGETCVGQGDIAGGAVEGSYIEPIVFAAPPS
jgi:hypothetical protein